LDTGCLYRLVALEVLERQVDYTKDLDKVIEIAHHIQLSKLTDKNIRSEEVGNVASITAVIPAVRDALYNIQRNFPHGKKGAIIEGRDIGTYIFPEADKKFFIVADLKIRAERRLSDHQKWGDNCQFSEIMDKLKERDERDSNRKIAPLKPAPDAIILENNSSFEDIITRIFSYLDF
jgi:cytidylate kinase